MTGSEIYKRTPAYERELTSIRLHAPQWKLLLAFDGQRSLTEVALSSDTPFVDALPLTEKFLGSGWLEEQPITLDQYLKRTGAANASGSAVLPAVVLHEPKPEGAIPPPPASTPLPAPTLSTPPPPAKAPAPPAPTPASSTAYIPRPTAPPTIPSAMPPRPAPPSLPSALAPRPPAPASPPPPPLVNRPRGVLRIKSVVDYIISQIGNNSLGQLVVYRVFLRIPPQLLQMEDIASVHLANDAGLVKSEPLKQAVAQAVMEVLKKPLPDSVFAPV